MDSFPVISCNTADEFLNALSLCNPSWWTEPECHWIFRGQSSSCELIPSLYRKCNADSGQLIYQNKFDEIHDKLLNTVPDMPSAITNTLLSSFNDLRDASRSKIEEIIKACFVELTLTENFLLRCNDIRLPTPTLKLFQSQYSNISAVEFFYYNLATKFIKDFLRSYDRHSEQSYLLFNRFMPFDFPEAMALARHHNIPSRLLDWSNDPLIAAYFSTYHEMDKICVWALNKRYLNKNPEQGQIEFYDKLTKTGLEFLHIQKGLFTDMIGIEEYYYKYGKWPTLDQYLLSTNTSENKPIPQENYLKKIELPSSEKFILLKKLNRMGINKYNLMPTYDNVAYSVLP